MSTSKQDRRIKAEKAAEQEAGRIIEEAKAKVRRNAAAREAGDTAPAPASPRRRTLDPALLAHAPAIKAAREQGVAWWRVAHDLGLPGSADNVSQGKAGAGLARRIYAGAYGALPPRKVSERTAQARERRTDRNEHVAEIKAETRDQRLAKAKAGLGVIKEDLPSDELVAMLKGRKISWLVNLNDLDGKGDDYAEFEARIHPKWCRIVEGKSGRAVHFKELDETRKQADARSRPGIARTIRLAAIFAVR